MIQNYPETMQIGPALIKNNPNQSDNAKEMLGGSGWAG